MLITNLLKTSAILACAPMVLLAQSVEMADALRSDGKIWIVILSLGILLAGVYYFLWRTDQKIDRLKKDLKS